MIPQNPLVGTFTPIWTERNKPAEGLESEYVILFDAPFSLEQKQIAIE